MARIRLVLLFLICIVSQVHAQYSVDTTLPELIPYRKGRLWGFCDREKNIVIQPQYYAVSPFKFNYAEVWIDTLYKGIVNIKGDLIMKAGRDTLLYVTDQGRAYKYFDKGAIEVAEPGGNLFKPKKYIIESAFTSTSFIAKNDGKRGVVDNRENIIIPFRYLEIGYPDNSGYTSVNIKGRQAIVDTLGRKVSPIFKEYTLGGFRNGRAKIYKKGKYTNIGFVDYTGKLVIDTVYRYAEDFLDSISVVGNGYRYGAINLKGDTIIPFKFGSISNFEMGKASFIDGYQCGIIDKTGKQIFTTIGRRAFYIHEDLIVVEKVDPKNKWNSLFGIVTINGVEKLPFEYSRIYYSGSGLFYVTEKGYKDYYMDLKFNKYYED